MRIQHSFGFVAVASVLLALPGAWVVGAHDPAHRIHQDLHARSSFILENSTSPRIAAANDLGELPASAELSHLTLHFRLSNAQQSDLDALVKRQADRTSRDYHKWLTPEQFAARYGLADADLEKVSQWLESNGLTVTETAHSKTWIAFTGTAAAVANAFGTSLHRYSLAGIEHFANREPITLPAALNGVVGSVRGLNSFHPRPHISLSKASRPGPHFTSSISGNTFITPDDFATIYDLKPLYNGGINGSGQKIAVAGQTDIDLTDIRAFRQASGLPASDPQVVLDGRDPGTSSSDLGEADLDIEWAGAVAPQATIIYVNSADAFNSAIYAVDNNLAPVLTLSYGSCEAQYSASDLNTLQSVFQQGNAQGITTVAATGDTGAADCDGPTSPTAKNPTSATQGLAVDVPSSLPSVTAMGGTTLQEGTGTYWSSSNNSSNGSALSHIPEVAWNDTVLEGQLAASNGGKSNFFAKPSWQMGLNVPNDGARDTPDLAFAASPDHDGYLVCSGGTCVNGFRNTDSTLNVVGGVSVAAPTFAGVVALLNQQTNGRQGNVNPGLYSLASLSTNAFHDVTYGNNIVPCTAGSTGCPASGSIGFSAGPGYDQVTGLGSVDAYNLITQWGSDFNVTVAPTALTVNPGTSNTASVQIASLANFSGAVSFTCTVAAPLANTTCSIPGSVTGSGTTTLTVANTSSARSAPPPFHLPRPGGMGWLLSAGLALLLAAWFLRSAAPRARFLLGSAAAALALLLVGCDEGSSGSTSSTVTQTQTLAPVTGNVIVTGKSGIETHSTTLVVTVP